MTTAALQRIDDNQLKLTGQLDFYSVPKLWQQLRPLLQKAQPVILDLGSLENTNSAGLAMLIEAMDVVKKSGGTLQLLHPPESLLEIAQMCHVTELIQGSAG